MVVVLEALTDWMRSPSLRSWTGREGRRTAPSQEKTVGEGHCPNIGEKCWRTLSWTSEMRGWRRGEMGNRKVRGVRGDLREGKDSASK